MRLPGRWARARMDPTEIERQQDTWADLKAGRLPASARERLAGAAAAHVFTSELSTRELVALRAGALEPVGQAFGTATFVVSPSAQSFAQYAVHPYSQWGNPSAAASNRAYRIGFPVSPRLVSGYHDGVNNARAAALKRMRKECVALDGDGVLGIRIVRSSPVHGLHEFTVIGTAVRDSSRRGSATSGEPFTTVLSCVDVALLRAAGWVPVRVVYEHQRYGGHGGWVSLGGGRLNPLQYSAQELSAASAVMAHAGEQTRRRMHADLVAGGGLILSSYDVDTDVQQCRVVEGHTDFVVDVQALGTSIAPVRSFRVSGETPALPITPVLRLTD